MSQSPSSASIPTRRKRDSRESILQAAEEIVAKRGPAHLTLETAANEAKVSKGGLFYHFRSKEALLEAMIRRSMQLLETEHTKVAESLTGERNGKLKANIIGTLRHLEGQRPVLTAVMAAIANDPKVGGTDAGIFQKRISGPLQRAQLCDGRCRSPLSRLPRSCYSWSCLVSSFLTPSQIRKVTQRMLQLVEEFDRTDSVSVGEAISRT